MKRMRIYMMFFSVIALQVFSSCFDDKGNYDYTPIGEAIVSIPGVTDNNNRYVCEQYAVLKLNPAITYEAGTSEADYEYKWLKYTQTSQKDEEDNYVQPDVIGTTKDLEYTVNDAPNEFWMVLKVTNKKSNIVTDYRFEFIVTSVNGWVVLDENASGEEDLHIIRDAEITLDMPAGKEGVTRNYFSAKNGGMKMTGAQVLGYCPNVNDKALFAFTGNGVYWANPGTYTLIPDKMYNQLFTVAPDVAAPQSQYYSSLNGGVDVLVNDGDVYTIAWSLMGWGRRTYNKKALTAGDYQASPWIAPITTSTTDYAAVLYDELNHRFLTVSRFAAIAAPASSGLFDTGDLGEDMNLLSMGEAIDGSTGAVFSKNVGGQDKEIWLYQADFTKDTPVPTQKIDLTAFDGIQDANVFAFGIRGNFMYYATGEKIYCYRYSKEQPNEFLTIGAGETVTSMKVYVNPDNAEFNGKILFIATEKAGAGKVYKVKFNEMNGSRVGDVEIFDNFGRIKDMLYKQ